MLGWSRTRDNGEFVAIAVVFRLKCMLLPQQELFMSRSIREQIACVKVVFLPAFR